MFREVPGTEKEVSKYPLAPIATDNGMVLELEQIHVFTSAASFPLPFPGSFIHSPILVITQSANNC